MLHQSPCWVPGTRRISATPLPVSSALAGQTIARRRQNVIATSSRPQVRIDTRICAIESSKPRLTWPRICTDTRTEATCSRGSRRLGGTTG